MNPRPELQLLACVLGLCLRVDLSSRREVVVVGLPRFRLELGGDVCSQVCDRLEDGQVLCQPLVGDLRNLLLLDLEDGHRRVDGHARLVALGVEVRAVEAERLLLARLHANDFPVKAFGHEALAAHVGLRCCGQVGDSRAVFLEASHADEDAVSRAHFVLLGGGHVLGVLLGNLCDLLVDKRLVDAEGLRGNTHGLIRRELVALLREHLEREGGRLAPLQLVRAFHAG